MKKGTKKPAPASAPLPPHQTPELKELLRKMNLEEPGRGPKTRPPLPGYTLNDDTTLGELKRRRYEGQIVFKRDPTQQVDCMVECLFLTPDRTVSGILVGHDRRIWGVLRESTIQKMDLKPGDEVYVTVKTRHRAQEEFQAGDHWALATVDGRAVKP